jgi:hypothetical protein
MLSGGAQSGGEVGLKLLGQLLRQKQMNKLQEQETASQAELAKALNQPTTMQLESIDGSPMPQLSRTQQSADAASMNQLSKITDPSAQMTGYQILGARKDLRQPSMFEQKQILQKDRQAFEASQNEHMRDWKYGIHEDDLAEAEKNRGLRRELAEKNDRLQRDLAKQDVELKRELEAAKAASGLDLTDSQGKATTFSVRMENSGQVLDAVGKEFTGFLSRGVPATMSGWRSAERQRFDQAERNFINAQLRRESGAVINPNEFVEARKQYIPQPGDTAEVLEQKALNRMEVIEGMKVESGGGYEVLRERVPKPAPFGGDGGDVSNEDQALMDKYLSP